jgi:hypothetical protein
MPPAGAIAQVASAKGNCMHHEDATDNKCYDACAHGYRGAFKVKGMDKMGPCPSKYDKVDSHKNVRQCTDGVTNIKYCAGGNLKVVDFLERTHGISTADASIPFTAAVEDTSVTRLPLFADYPTRTRNDPHDPPMNKFYLHQVDQADHKCFEASSSHMFSSKGITSKGKCPTDFNTVDKSVVVQQCPDGVTSIRYCSPINVTIATKGESGSLIQQIDSQGKPFTISCNDHNTIKVCDVDSACAWSHWGCVKKK